MADVLSIVSLNMNQETTQDSTYKKEIMSKTNYTKELPEHFFPIRFKLFGRYQCKYPSLKTKYELGT